MPPVVLTITAHDTATPILRSLQAEVHKLGASGSSATSGLAALSGATQRLGATVTTGTGNIHAWKQAQEEAAAAVKKAGDEAGGAAPKVHTVSGGFLSGVKSALAFGAGMAGVSLAAGAVGSALGAIIGHVVGFESAMANVNTLGNNSIEVQARLRDQLLKLPAALGDSITLARGLYDVLSAGIAPAESVQFLATSATLAKAGLADLGITTEALTKTMAAFKIPTELAAQVADVLFKTVDLGQGNLQAFARAMPSVTQVSASMGISFVDTTSAMAALTQTFRNADTAATGYRSLLIQLIQNSDKFASMGVNITRVLSEQGLAGALRVLQDLTGGNSEKMKFFVNDVEGLAAAQALTGPQFELFLANLDKTRDSLGTVSKGFKIQQQTASEAWKAMAAEGGKVADNISPPFLAAFVAIAKGAQLYAADVNRIINTIKLGPSPIIQVEIDRQNALLKAQGAQLQTTSGFWGMLARATANHGDVASANSLETRGLIQSMIEADEATGKLSKGARAAADALNFGGTAAGEAGMSVAQLNEQLLKNAGTSTASGKATQQLSNDLAGLALTAANFKPGALKLIDPEDAKKSIDAAIAQFGRIEASGQVSFTAILAQAKSMLDGIRDQMGASSPVTLAFAAMVEGMEAKGRVELGKIPALFAAMGLQSRAELQKLAVDGAKDLSALAGSNEATTTELVGAWEKAMLAITAGEFPKLPVEWAKANALVLSRLQQAGVALTAEQGTIIANMIASVQQGARQGIEGIAKVVVDGQAQIVSAGSNTTAQLIESWQRVDAAGKTSFGNVAESAKTAFVRVAADGKQSLTNLAADATDAGTKAAGGFTTSIGAIGPAMEKLRNEVKSKLWDGLIADANKTNTDLGKGLSFTGQSFSETFAKVTEAARLYGANFGAALDETTKKAAVDFGLISKSAADMSTSVKGSFEAATEATNAYGNALVQTSDATTKLMNAKISVKESFADDIPGLRKQLDRARAEFTRIQREPEPLDSTGFKKATLAALGKAIDIITEKLKGLGMDLAAAKTNPFDAATAGAVELGKGLDTVIAKTDTLAASTARLTTQTTAAASAAARAAGNYTRLGLGDITFKDPQRLPGSSSGDFAPGGRLPPGSAVQPMPLRPGPSPGNPRPPGFNIPGRPIQRFATGGIVQGSGGIDSVHALLTPGERVSTPGQDRAVSVSFGNVIINVPPGPGGSNPVEMGRAAAQEFVRNVAPALNESLRRGGGERFA